jgi:hypothetical protein
MIDVNDFFDDEEWRNLIRQTKIKSMRTKGKTHPRIEVPAVFSMCRNTNGFVGIG